ncbi:hypothetical protein [Tardiphaga sp.]|jgi:hypothetical protein|uniref:hypothetical protein n=1 Tax=Tardiphaga sp. TaxID=1926292 RepID=UPI0037DA031B
MSDRPAVLPPTSLGAAVRPLAIMPDDEYHRLLEVISGPQSFSPSKQTYARLEREAPSLSANLNFLLAALSYLSSQTERFEEAGQRIDTVVDSLVAELDEDAQWGDAKKVAYERLLEIFTQNRLAKNYKKLERLRTGFLPNAVAFSSFVDLRPNFADETTEAIQFLPVVQFRVTTDADAVSAREHIFQLTEDGLGLMKEAIERVETKLKTLKEDATINAKIVS